MKIDHEIIIDLLQQLIASPSISREEDQTAEIIFRFLETSGVRALRQKNNVWAQNKYFDNRKPTLLLNSHHDTVKPNPGYTRNPFLPVIEAGKLYGLGSNDAGGCLVALLAAFLNFYDEQDLPYNLVFAATAEEEISGKDGIESLIPTLPPLAFAIVGEPTSMEIAVAEKGLMVLDCLTDGIAGHAAREEGENAIYKAIKDIAWFSNYQFEEISEVLGPVKMNVTVIEAGSQHNVIPDSCQFVVDVRTTDAYSNLETLEIIRSHISAQVTPRSTRLNPSGVSQNHPVVKVGKKLGLKTYGSPTLSDQALLHIPSIKLGPGESARSHTADEFVLIREITDGIDIYNALLGNIDKLH